MIALVTGGSRGIGRAIVESLLAEGWTVAFTYRTEERSARAIEAASGGRGHAFQLDLRQGDRATALIEEVEKTVGPIDGLVNNAAARRDALLASTPDAEFEEVIDVNIGGAFRLCRAVLPQMMVRRRGSIVNVSSLSAIAGVAGQSVYGASKAALVGLTRSLAREVGKRNVRVNAVLPGFVITETTSALPEQVIATLRAKECLPAGTSAADVANAVSFLLSDRATAITGQMVIVDSGASA